MNNIWRGFNKFFRALFVVSVICITSGVLTYAVTLPELNQSTEAYRTYNFARYETNKIYQNMGITSGGVFTINGTNKNYNTINFNNLSGFIVSKVQTTLNINNLTLSGARSTIGSVLYNIASDSQITLINLKVNNNSAITTDSAYGGAIYTFNPLTLTNVSLQGNSARTSSEGNEALGGAIYARDSVSMIADSENVVIVDNYTEDTEGFNNNAIYMANPDSTLTIQAKNNAYINIQDNIKGENGYKVDISGDTSGKVGLNDSIYNASEINISNTDITMVDEKIKNHQLNNLRIGENVSFTVDADLENQTADNISSLNGEGTVYITDLNIISYSLAGVIKLQILKNPGNLILNIDNLSSNITTEVQATMYNSSILADSINLGTTSSTNDSIVIVGPKDVLYEMVKDNNPQHRLKNFIFNKPMEYNLSRDLEESPQETVLTIYNLSDEVNGVINANNHSMFKLSKPVTSVNLKDITVKNAKTETDGSVVNISDNTATFNATDSTLTNNSADGNGGAIYVKTGNLSLNNSTLSENHSGGNGGAVYVTDNSNVNIVNTEFKDNIAEGKGGAIYTESTVNISADKGVTKFEGNTDSTGSNAIYAGSDATVNLKAINGGKIILNDKISGDEGYKLNISGSSNGNVTLYNSVENADITLSGANLNLSQDDNLKGNKFNAKGGTLNLENGKVGKTDFSQLSTKGTTKVKVDVDLANKKMDRITADSYKNVKGTINVSHMHLLSDSDEKHTKIFFAASPLKKHVKSSVKSVAYSPVYRYIVNYNSSNGYFMFDRGSDNDPTSFNPAVLASSVAQQMAYMNQLQNYQAAMYHNDTFMSLPKNVRLTMIRNGIASEKFDTSQDVMSHLQIPEEVRSIWIRPYASFEHIPLKRGPKVSAINYGTLAGGESDMIQLSHGFTMVYGGYLGYNGNNYHYSDVDAVQQGATLGAIMYLYRGNFFNTLTANVGWMINDSDTIYGSDTMNMIMSGFADKIGYNFELSQGKIIIQPSVMMGYTFVYSSNYTTANDVKIDSDPLHAVHFIPGLKIIGNLANGWQPYACINIVCNFMDKTHITADNVQLPDMSVDPYVEYGLGIQKRWSDKYSGFAQATVRNGGRRGGALLFGFRCMLGKLKTTVIAPHEDAKPKKVLFKERKKPRFVVEGVNKGVNKGGKGANEPKEMHIKAKKDGKKFKFNIKNIFKREKRKMLYQYNTDVSAKVVTDVYGDGVIMTSLDGLKSETKSVYTDNSEMDYFNHDDKGTFETEEVINVNKTVKTKSVEQHLVKSSNVIVKSGDKIVRKQSVQEKKEVVTHPNQNVLNTNQADENTEYIVNSGINKADCIKHIVKMNIKEFRNQIKLKKTIKPHKYSDFIFEFVDFKF